MFRLIPVILVLAVSVFPAWAQTTSAGIQGTVADSTGGVLPGVEVTVINVDTNATRMNVTDDTGRFNVGQLNLGNYEVRAALEGFQTAVRQDIQLTIGQQVQLSLTMNIGAISEQVIVTEAAPLVDIISGEVSGLVDSNQIRDLPLNGRSFTELAVLQPGVNTARAAGRSLIVGMGVKISVNGSRTNASGFILDGTDINDSMGQAPGSVTGVTLGVETVREFKTLTSNFSAEYGRAAGGVVSAVTKSGTNQLHGSIFHFHRNSAMDANQFFANKNGQAKPGFKRNQFGAVIGGPIIKDKTFFLGSFEMMKNRQGMSSANVDVPSAAARNGDLNGDGIADVAIMAAVKPYLSLYPLPNVPGKMDAGDGTGEWSQVFSKQQNEEYFLAKIDQTLSDTDSFFGRWTIQDANALSPSNLADSADFDDTTTAQYVTLEEKHIFSPQLLNVARVGFNRSLLNAADSVNKSIADDPKYAFIQTPPGSFEHMGQIQVDGLSNIGRSFNRPRFRVLNLFEYSDTLTYTTGDHSLKFGVKYQRYHVNHNQSNREFGVFTFDSLEQFLTGDAATFGGAIPAGRDYRRGARQHIPSLFVQDDWQYSPNLALNLGIRWEAATANNNVNGKSATMNPFTGVKAHLQNPNYQVPMNNFAPRIGFAWDPGGTGKTAIRGGFGMFHQMILADFYFGARQQPPMVQQISIQDDTVPAGSPKWFPDPMGAPPSGAVGRVETVDYNVVTPYYMQWNLNIQRELMGNWAAVIAYVGSRGVNLTRYVNPNSAPFDVTRGGIHYWPPGRDDSGVACGSYIPNSRKVSLPDGCNKAKRRNVNFTRIRHRVNGGDSYYHSLQSSITKRFSSGYSLGANYTWSKSIDTSSQNASSDFNNTNTMSADYYNTRGNSRAVSTFHLNHSLGGNFTWELPLMDGAGGAAEAILGGWSMSGLFTVTSGTPVTLEMNDRINWENDVTNGSGSRPNVRAGMSTNPVTGNIDNWFDVTHFELGPRGYIGNLGRLTGRGDDFANFDVSLKKNLQMGEDAELQFRAEFFNVLNSTNFATPTGSRRRPYSSTSLKPNKKFGQLTRTDNEARQIQFALKIIF